MNEQVFDSGDISLLNSENQLTGTGKQLLCFPVYHFATRHKRCLLLHTQRFDDRYDHDGRIYSARGWFDGDQGDVLGYWNDTLGGYVVRPTPTNIREVCTWLDSLNRRH